jgi:phage terminase large subunit-like protein
MNEHEVLNAAARESFDVFAMRAFRIIEPGTTYEWSWHLGCIAEHLEACYRGEIKRLIINMPPRTLKSYEVARAFPAWVMGKRPESKFISTSYGYEVTEQNAMACRRIMKDDWYKKCFPQTIISPDLDRNTHFETTRAGQYYAASALSPITGIGCDYMIGDDLIKPMEASSETIRNSTNLNIRQTLFSRFNDKRTGVFILMMQRVHEDDPTGHLLKDGGYVHVKLPAENKTGKTILYSLNNKTWKMEPGELLFPTRLSREILDQAMLDMTPAIYAGQMLQEPVPVGGGEFLPEWPQHYPNGSLKPKTMNVYILVDAAGGDETNKKKKKTSDRTAMAVVGLAPDNNYYLLDLVIDRLNATERIDMLFILHRKWNEICGKPPRVGYEKYGLMTDVHYATKRMNEEGYRFSLIELGGKMAKEERIRRMIPDLQKSRWYFPDNLLYTDTEGRTLDMVKELTQSEMAVFPRARYDDGLDAITRIYDTEMGVIFPRIVQKNKFPVKTMDDKNAWVSW